MSRFFQAAFVSSRLQARLTTASDAKAHSTNQAFGSLNEKLSELAHRRAKFSAADMNVIRAIFRKQLERWDVPAWAEAYRTP